MCRNRREQTIGQASLFVTKPRRPTDWIHWPGLRVPYRLWMPLHPSPHLISCPCLRMIHLPSLPKLQARLQIRPLPMRWSPPWGPEQPVEGREHRLRTAATARRRAIRSFLHRNPSRSDRIIPSWAYRLRIGGMLRGRKIGPYHFSLVSPAMDRRSLAERKPWSIRAKSFVLARVMPT